MAVVRRNITRTSFAGGIARDSLLPADGQFEESKNIDIHQDLSSVCLSRRFEEISTAGTALASNEVDVLGTYWDARGDLNGVGTDRLFKIDISRSVVYSSTTISSNDRMEAYFHTTIKTLNSSGDDERQQHFIVKRGQEQYTIQSGNIVFPDSEGDSPSISTRDIDGVNAAQISPNSFGFVVFEEEQRPIFVEMDNSVYAFCHNQTIRFTWNPTAERWVGTKKLDEFAGYQPYAITIDGNYCSIYVHPTKEAVSHNSRRYVWNRAFLISDTTELSTWETYQDISGIVRAAINYEGTDFFVKLDHDDGIALLCYFAGSEEVVLGKLHGSVEPINQLISRNTIQLLDSRIALLIKGEAISVSIGDDFQPSEYDIFSIGNIVESDPFSIVEEFNLPQIIGNPVVLTKFITENGSDKKVIAITSTGGSTGLRIVQMVDVDSLSPYADGGYILTEQFTGQSGIVAKKDLQKMNLIANIPEGTRITIKVFTNGDRSLRSETHTIEGTDNRENKGDLDHIVPIPSLIRDRQSDIKMFQFKFTLYSNADHSKTPKLYGFSLDYDESIQK